MTLEEVLPRLTNVRRTGSGWMASCPCANAHKHADSTPSLSVREGENGRPLFHCFVGCQYPEIAAALGIERGNSRKRQVNPSRPPVDQASTEQERKDKRAAYIAWLWRRIWFEAQPIAGSPAEGYLRSRSISLISDDCLRFHPTCEHPSGDVFPAMIAIAGHWCGDSVTPCAVHRTYLRSDGAGKADIEPAKASLGSLRGAGVWLSLPAPILAVGEGIETVLSVATAMRERSDYAYAAAISAGNLAIFQIPDWAKELIILADRDEAGERAALTLAAKAKRDSGLIARIARPPEAFNDFNDALRASHGS
jgi:hypothetical protein